MVPLDQNLLVVVVTETIGGFEVPSIYRARVRALSPEQTRPDLWASHAARVAAEFL
jgi:hypothetical protein